ncbi:unnamed protein product [Porites evermanni]|uniref:ALOG domain-containing protein n=1 Tax=Porites evermanni TaxID=104178 RepID=A0ABN8R494_9CNID|nr:unnamed protein product [Porites evermanni]
MALDSNAQIGCSGSPLPHFTPFQTPGSRGVNVFAQDLASQENAYVFPPFILVGPLLRFLDKALFSFTIVVPKLSPLPYWWPLIQARASHFVVLGHKADHDIVLFPSPHHVFSTRPLPWDLYAFRITISLPIWKPAAPCLDCGYLNDADFNFCQRCGFRQFCSDSQHPSKRLKIDFQLIDDRQKSSIYKELINFLSSLPKFLVWKDNSGKTVVHLLDCPGLGQRQRVSCSCPTRLAAGTVDSLIGKLRSIFLEEGLGGEWDDRLGIGNPVSHPSIKAYLKCDEKSKPRLEYSLVRPFPFLQINFWL